LVSRPGRRVSHWQDVLAARGHERSPKPSERSQRALDWLNFFIADVETGFGPFIVVYLAASGWLQGQIGLVLTVGSVCGIASQLPGGAIVDGVRSKRTIVAVALVMVAAGALLFYVSAALWFVLLAQLLHGLTAGLITPAKAAIGLGLVGHRGLSQRLGRNHCYDSFGNASTAGAMGLLGHYVAKSASFLFAAFLCLPALWALFRIRGGEIDYARARNAKPGDTDGHPARYRDLLKNRQLLIFSGALVLFQIANASAIPLVTERLGQGDSGQSELIVAGLVIVPQVITALIAPWMAGRAHAWGRKPLLLFAFAALAVRVLLFTVAPGPPWLLPMQALSGIDAAVLGILSPLIIADVTAGSGRYNLAQGAVGMTTGIGAALSTTAIGYLAQWYGFTAGLLVLAAAAAAGFVFIVLLLKESRPADA
jgi:MFS family permease